jgi:ribosomal protein S27AE
MDKVIDFTALKIVRDRGKICKCSEISYAVDTENRMVTCGKCGAYIDTFDAIVSLANQPEILQRQIDHLKRMQRELLSYKPRLLIFKNLAQNYHKSKYGRMLPCCPACGEGFRFEEIRSWINENMCMRLKRKNDQSEDEI